VSKRSKASRISCFCSSVSSNLAAFLAAGLPPRAATALCGGEGDGGLGRDLEGVGTLGNSFAEADGELSARVCSYCARNSPFVREGRRKVGFFVNSISLR